MDWHIHDMLFLSQCKEKMRPVKRALKMLESPEENMNEKEQVAQTRQVRDIAVVVNQQW